ncbi:hypothetical protein AB0H63_06750 [Micromonospora echinospora]|uniref:hypothetical protein n=1 Tax=Micromonospora echinospora TaxID=1877 RepID=UPI0033FC4DF5
MQRKRITTLLLAAISTIGLMFALGTPAMAAPPSADGNSDVSITAADGYFYAWTGTYRSGTQCRWLNNSDDWGTCRNAASSAENRGYVGGFDDVRVYWGTSASGAYKCMGNGGYWLDLTLCVEKFDVGSPGNGQCINDNASSHRWASSC